MLKSCILEVKVWKDHSIDISFSYEHTPNGTNGHDTNIRIKVLDDGRVYEVE